MEFILGAYKITTGETNGNVGYFGTQSSLYIKQIENIKSLPACLHVQTTFQSWKILWIFKNVNLSMHSIHGWGIKTVIIITCRGIKCDTSFDIVYQKHFKWLASRG